MQIRCMSTRILKRMIDAKVTAKKNESVVLVKFDDGKETCYHGIWLRDHCKCPNCYHAQTKQRLVDTVEIPIDIKPRSVAINENNLHIKWPDGHQSSFESSWLHRNSYNPTIRLKSQRNHVLWGKDLINNLPTVSYEDVMNEGKDGLKRWLNNIVRSNILTPKDSIGIGFVNGVPLNPKVVKYLKNKDTERLARRIAHIKETHYGVFHDWTSNLEHGDTAYTNLALAAHTDTTYYTDPMGLQAFHLLHHHGEGGESLFVDGFNAAKRLAEQAPWAYKSLSTERISAVSIGDSKVYMQQSPASGYPILNLDPITLDLYQIRFNNTDRSTLRPKDAISFYQALKEWIKVLKSPEFELRLHLRPGNLVMFNNWRVLHGRSSFTGSRRLTGCYIGMDDFKSRLKILNQESKTDI